MIRREQPHDHAGIAEVTAQAFATAMHSDRTEPAIVGRLRAAGALTVSLVAIDQGEIVGHVAISPVTIDARDRGWFGLGPVSVRPDRQAIGWGSALIRRGLERLRARGAEGCVVLGDPGYYRRFGFEHDDDLRYDEAPAEYFMRLPFGSRVPAGRVEYHPAFAGN